MSDRFPITPARLREICENAGPTHQRLRFHKNDWPANMRAVWVEYDPGWLGSLWDEADVKPAAPTPEEIDEYDYFCQLLLGLNGDERGVVMARVEGRSWRRIMVQRKRMGRRGNHTTVRRIFKRAMANMLTYAWKIEAEKPRREVASISEPTGSPA